MGLLFIDFGQAPNPCCWSQVDGGPARGNCIPSSGISEVLSLNSLGRHNPGAQSVVRSVLEIPLGSSGQMLVITDSVLRHFSVHSQMEPWHFEGGGQLFAVVSPLELWICEATGPRPTDKRSRFRYKPDRKAEQAEIKEAHTRKLQYVGDWHTHPEAMPHPSPTDYSNMSDCFRKSKHFLNAFILIIVGNGELPQSLHLSLHDQNGYLEQLEIGELDRPNHRTGRVAHPFCHLHQT
jgi:integrative and conjugative element protein (TIGR02256 family)